jgi:hypothetical protein
MTVLADLVQEEHILMVLVQILAKFAQKDNIHMLVILVVRIAQRDLLQNKDQLIVFLAQLENMQTKKVVLLVQTVLLDIIHHRVKQHALLAL